MRPRPTHRPSRYSRFVRTMRIALPVTAISVVAVVALWPHLGGIDGSFILPDVRDVELEVDGRVRLDNPEYVGQGRAGEAYRVEAGAARVDPLAPGRVELEHMRVDLPGSARGRDLEVRSVGALYDRDAATLDLDGDIRVRTSDGYELRTEAAHVDVANGTVVTSTPVDGEGPRGSIVADRMEIEARGEVVRFEGRVRARLLTGDEG
jgi:lipopolysaccharide export system protein LptC